MSENGFTPLSPRRLHPRVVIDSGSEPVAPLEPAVHDGVLAAEAIEFAAAQPDPPQEVARRDDSPDMADVDVELDAARIRAAAIEIAAVACARALRYAVDRNPRLLARFVDDALRAAGGPQHAVVRLAASAAISGCDPGRHDFVADPSLSACDIFIECADGTLGATIEQRAQGLVRAASS